MTTTKNTGDVIAVAIFSALTTFAACSLVYCIVTDNDGFWGPILSLTLGIVYTTTYIKKAIKETAS